MEHCESIVVCQLSFETENESALFKAASIQGSKKNMESNYFLKIHQKTNFISWVLDAETRFEVIDD